MSKEGLAAGGCLDQYCDSQMLLQNFVYEKNAFLATALLFELADDIL
jgi:hypothetical protein